MLYDGSDDKANVTGITYAEAASNVQRVEHAISLHVDKGFSSYDECAEFAREYHLDNVVYMKSHGDYRYVTHMGDALTRTAWALMYREVLFWTEEGERGEDVRKYWTPNSYAHVRAAKLYGEQSDGKYPALYSRNYFVPTGYYDEVTGTFNVARPITTFAEATGADTTDIHTLLQHIAGECYPHLLSWLRAKMIRPTVKTGVVPIFVGAQGTGKSTFGDCICTALFGEDNVIVTDQFDATARFNADNADALIVSIEEKMQDDRRNTSSNLKSRATAKKVRKENKGVDPIFQASYTDFIMTTNEVVPLKFDDRGNQRRFMVMEVDAEFTREQSRLADEVFTKLYGEDAAGEKVGEGLVRAKARVAQFKSELWEQKGFEGISYRNFPKTAAYDRCFNVPRTNEAVDIENILKALVPFIKETLATRTVPNKIMTHHDGEQVATYLDDVASAYTIQFVQGYEGRAHRVAICRQEIFKEAGYNKPYAHSVVERVLLDMRPWLRTQGLDLLSNTMAPSKGFRYLQGKAKYAAAAWFMEYKDPLDQYRDAQDDERIEAMKGTPAVANGSRSGQRVRYNHRFVYDEDGEFETLNELKPGCTDRRKENALYLDTFLLEADDTSALTEAYEVQKLGGMGLYKSEPWDAEAIYSERLKVQHAEARRLFDSGIACRLVYSGSKSIHILVRVKDAPYDMEQREWLDAYLKATLSDKLYFDKSTKDPTRLTRAPITRERVTNVMKYDRVAPDAFYDKAAKLVGMQRLLAEDWGRVYDIDWRPMYEAWCGMKASKYEERGRMLPSKKVYKDAACALLDGTFFTDRKFDGNRQQTFFPAYRILRAMGYTHDELWLEIGIQVSGYRKRDEIPYWLGRKTCRLVRSIDEDIDGSL
jgi:ABC-type oligopeptide transport system ATPase subunit